MTKYIQLLKKQRNQLALRANSMSHLEKMMSKYRSPDTSFFKTHYKAMNLVYMKDKEIYNECKVFGYLRFKVMGN